MFFKTKIRIKNLQKTIARNFGRHEKVKIESICYHSNRQEENEKIQARKCMINWKRLENCVWRLRKAEIRENKFKRRKNPRGKHENAKKEEKKFCSIFHLIFQENYLNFQVIFTNFFFQCPRSIFIKGIGARFFEIFPSI